MERFYYFFALLEIPLPGSNPNDAPAQDLQNIINIVLAITGAIAVLIVVLAGFRFITSQGSPNEIATARNAIIYSLVGLVVIMFAFSIVNFVIGEV